MSTQPAVPAVTRTELRAAADTLAMTLSDAELDMYASFMAGLTADFNLIAGLEAPRLPVKYPRGNGHRPGTDENPYNAWYWKCSIKGAPGGRLAGKRVIIKDNIGVAGLPMMNGAKVMDGFMPDEDATVVTRVLDAGAEVVGKAVCENFCFSGGSHTSATGPVRNPRNPDYMTGGSSSGCAALLLTGEADLAIGSDQGGSVRMPASFSGIVGIKPTYGLVPYTGAAPIEQSVDHLGPMAMSSADCALLLEVIAGYDDGRDPRQFAGLAPKPYVASLAQGVKGMRFGLVREGFGTPGAEADVDAMVRAAALRLREAGATVEEISVPMHAQGPSIMFTSIMDNALSTFTDQGASGPNVRGHFPLAAIEFYRRAHRERADDFPVTVKTVLLFGLAMRRRYGHYYSAKAHNLVRSLRAAYDEALTRCDILVMPTTPMKAHRIPPPDAGPEAIMGCALDMTGNTSPFDASGHPSMSVPAGMSDGLPVGIMFTGRHGEDDVVLRAGHALEQVLA
jgi:amidase